MGVMVNMSTGREFGVAQLVRHWPLFCWLNLVVGCNKFESHHLRLFKKSPGLRLLTWLPLSHIKPSMPVKMPN